MRNWYIIAFISALLLGGGGRDAYAANSSSGSCVDLSKAKALAAWAVASGATYSNDNRSCSSGSALSGAPSGSPSVTGYCSTYDCSSFATWILRQIPGQHTVNAAPAGPLDTYDIWGSTTAGAQSGSPSGMKPCDPTKQPVCLGLTEFGEGGMSGPGHIVTELCGKVYSASPPIEDNYVTPTSGSLQQSSEGVIAWVTPFGLEQASMNSCSSSCSPSATAGGYGGAGANGAGANAADENEQLGMMEMMEMMEPMMGMMSGLSGLGSGSSTTGSGTAANGSTANGTDGTNAASAAATTGSGTAAGTAAAADTAGSGTAASSNTAAGGFSSLVNRLSLILTGSSGTAATSGTAAAAATTPSVLAPSTAAQDLQNLDQQAADETPALNSSLTADPAAADPTQDYGTPGTPDHRLSCALTAGATVESCRISSGSP